MDVLEELNNLTIWDASTLKNKKEIENVIDALTQAQYNYNREDVGMSAEDLATIFGKEKATKLEKNYQESYEQNYGRSPK
jgi:ABC-type Fe3+-hydroxamate transport system substrate-binding protein